MIRDELEYSISQYIDGTLPPLELAALEQRLASDAEARGILAEYQKLDATLKSSLPIPVDVDWEGLTSRIIRAVAQEEAPIRHYSMKWVRPAATWAVAAVLFMAVGVTLRMQWKTLPAGPSSSGPVARNSAAPIVHVAGPQIQTSNAPAVKRVSIGHSPSLNLSDLQSRYTDGVVARPSRVIIASGTASAQDTHSMMPY